MAQNIFKGLGIALITPFTQDGEVDYKALTRLVDYQIQNGADFLCILATTGETPCLSTDEKHKIKELVIDRVRGRLPILMGCGGNNTRAVVEELRNTDLRGIDGVRYIYFDDNDSRYIRESNDTTVLSDPTFTVVQKCGCPAVLVEEGFITNAGDVALVATDAACEAAAQAYYECILTYFDLT